MLKEIIWKTNLIDFTARRVTAMKFNLEVAMIKQQQQQLGILGTISACALRLRKSMETCGEMVGPDA
jgi:hypothetical protein